MHHFIFFFKIFFYVDFFKVFIEFVTILVLFYVLFFFGPEACGILAPQPGTKPILLALEGKVLITRLPGKSLMDLFLPLMSLGGESV